MKMLSNVVGVSWDSLRNVPMANVYQNVYDKCQRTSEGLYLLPDGVEATELAERHSTIDTRVYESFTDYTKDRSDKFDISLSILSSDPAKSVTASFSKESQSIKKKSTSQSTTILENFYQLKAYELKLGHADKLSDTFKWRVLEINKTTDPQQVQYLAQLLVRDYGTHIIESAVVGGEVRQLDYLTAEGLKESNIKLDAIKASAAAKFQEKMAVDFSAERNKQKNETLESSVSFQQSEFTARGGPDITKVIAQVVNNSASKQGLTAMDHVVPLQRTAKWLHSAIGSPDLGLEPHQVIKVETAIRNASVEYYKRNTRHGCMDPNLAGFDFSANVNDESKCNNKPHNYTFYGVYAACGGDPEACKRSRIMEQVTGHTNCPPGAKDIKVASPVFFFNGSNIEMQYKKGYEYANLQISLCFSDVSLPHYQGQMFGGLFTTTRSNPITRSPSCPGAYTALELKILTMCLSEQYATDQRYAISFGGFVSCETEEKNCPNGYTNYFVGTYNVLSNKIRQSHWAFYFAGCDLYYCIKPSEIPIFNSTSVERPPFMEVPNPESIVHRYL